MVTGYFSSQVLGAKGMWSTGSERGRGLAALVGHRLVLSSGQTGGFVQSVGRDPLRVQDTEPHVRPSACPDSSFQCFREASDSSLGIWKSLQEWLFSPRL